VNNEEDNNNKLRQYYWDNNYKDKDLNDKHNWLLKMNNYSNTCNNKQECPLIQLEEDLEILIMIHHMT